MENVVLIPQWAKREQFARLIGEGRTIAAMRMVGVHYRTGRRWPRGRTITTAAGAVLKYEPVIIVQPEISARFLADDERVTIADLRHLFLHQTHLISRVTDRVLEDMKSWQARSLDPVYPVILIDAIVLKVRSGQVANRPVYVALGVTVDGFRDVLGMWVGPSGGEGAKQWMNLLADLRNRGILDACIVCCDGLKGLPEAIIATWPQATVQTCVVHLVRNSLRYASKKDWKPITAGLKRIYTAPSMDAAEAEFDDFARQWSGTYPAMIAMWRRSWEDFVPFLGFPPEVRRLVYTTNAIESLNARFRAATRRRGHFPDEESALKVLYLAIRHREPNRPNPTGQIAGWKNILNVLALTYGDRLGM